VLQDPVLFQGTIADNLRYGRLDASREEIVEAARAAGARGILVPTPATRSEEIAAAPEVAADLEAAVDRLLLADALAQLPADHRAVVHRAYYQGCTTAQIAADLHIAEGTVKSRLHDAVQALWLQLREMGVALQ